MKRSLILVVVLFPLFGLAALLHTARLQASPPQSGGVTFTVNSTIDATDANPGDGVCETAVGNGECTLRAAVMETNVLSGTDEINLPNGLYTLTLQGTCENNSVAGDLDVNDDLILNGENITETIIDGYGGDRVISVFSIQPVQINNLSIVNGLSSCGPGAGGIVNAGTLFLENVTIAENDCSPGGSAGIGVGNFGTLHILASVISNNICDSASGGIFNSGYPSDATLIITNTAITQNPEGILNNGILTLTNSIVSENQGEGVDSKDGTAFIYNSTIINNALGIHVRAGIIQNSTIMGHRDGGIIVRYGGDGLKIISSTVSHNPAQGIKVELGNIVTIENSRIENNNETRPFSTGGGIEIQGDSIVTITGSTISGNSAGSGGGIFNTGTVTILNSTISNNHAADDGGGITNLGFTNLLDPDLDSRTIHLMNSTIVSNSATSGFNIFNTGSFTVENTIIAGSVDNCDGFSLISLGHNLESGDSCGLTSTGDITSTNPLLGPLQNNGGATPTHAIHQNSLAIDAGNNAACPTVDQRGASRPVDGDGDNDPVCDIGAFEYGAQLAAIPDFITITPNTPILIDVLSNDLSGPNGVPILESIGEPMSGTAVITDSLVLYTPDLDFIGTDTFTYTITDGVLTDTAVVTVTVLPLIAPTAVDDTAETNENEPVLIDVLANDVPGSSGDPLLESVGEPGDGTAVITNSLVIYTPDLDFTGTDAFTYAITDGVVTDTAVVTVTVLPLIAPTAVDDTAETLEDEPVLMDVLANDLPGSSGNPVLDSVGEPGNGTAVITGTFILYTPAPDFLGTDTFTYTITDGVLTDTAVVTVTVLPVDGQIYIYLPVVLKP